MKGPNAKLSSGRFMTPDPYRASGGGPGNNADPGSWNRYSYTGSDPVNYFDPAGLERFFPMSYDGPDGYTGNGYPDQQWYASGGMFSCQEGSGGSACFQLLLPISVQIGSGGGGGSDPLSNARAALDRVAPALRDAAALQDVFTAEQLDCISGIETGRTWNPDIVATNGRIGLFQFNQNSWAYSGTSIRWNGGAAAKDAYTAATVALALLYRSLGYGGVDMPTVEAIQQAIDKFGEHDGRYGQAVMDCADKLRRGDFAGALEILSDYASLGTAGRP